MNLFKKNFFICRYKVSGRLDRIIYTKDLFIIKLRSKIKNKIRFSAGANELQKIKWLEDHFRCCLSWVISKMVEQIDDLDPEACEPGELAQTKFIAL